MMGIMIGDCNVPKVLSEEILYEGKFKGIREKVQYPSGITATYETILHPGAVVVLPVTENGELILIRQYRHSIKKEILEFPAGGLEKGENVELCAIRELEEEIHFTAAELIPLGVLYPTPGFCDEIQYLFLARKLTPGFREGDPDEFISPVFLNVSAVEEKIKNGEIMDGKTLAIFLRARLMNYL